MHDQIDKFKKYTVENTLHHVLIKILSDYSVPLLEACCYYGSVNIFFFLISNLDFQINQKCFQYSFIGGNTDIINECMKNYNIDRNCLNDIVSCHNNQFLEYIFDDEIFQPQNFNITNIIMSQNLKAVYLLFKKDKNSIYPLCTAFSPTIDILNNEDIDLSKAYSDYSPMNYSAMYNTYEIAEFILSHGMKIKGTSYLFTAAQNNSIETAKVLISHGIDINGRDNIDRTALHIAAENNSKETAEFLIANGIDINARNSVSQTALHNATCSNSIEIAEILIKHGIDKNVRDSDSKTALYYAVINNYKEIARVLISPEIEFNYKYKNEETILHIALNHNYNEIAKMLITNGADVNIKNKNNESLLHIATDHNNKEIVELLISHGSNINAKDFWGKTALHNAIIKNYKDIAEILIAHGAQINEKDKWGKKLLFIKQRIIIVDKQLKFL
ncbi:ankyrin repeat protein, putative [Trichomonas vaginalis G3]|uniref:Ankyrin repeat protein, putative n=1 Tax=Trichomonas vaginalis (strain ATCC PRA-98 / G3) TaxID=412133 RepID=A2EVK5_TRIV3|nr:spectrin binding [Trichomonas vaginalis G3]EAY03337.1 ankyrin repeat protein, putative [Trichomonas vaginalis G3]KAI5498314.1 spectrin binding [Trichomonas vaginalis G3]|eukprot:XP_001315560.1 ankyrin repeat protein [Trichomonas vaginalis G3]